MLAGSHPHDKEDAMHRRLLACGALLAALVAGCTSGQASPPRGTSAAPTAGPSGPAATPSSAYTVSYKPSDFTADVTNQWFPLKPGTTLVYRGTRDGRQVVEDLT